MSIQVWRPENERPGRHFVYTTRYVYFFVQLLDQLDDRAGLDQLLRRVRKRQGDFINHPKLWEDICLTYGRVIRRAGNINEGHEEGIFKPIGWEEFVANTGRLENLTDLAPESTSLLELLRDSIELKKLNNNLMKVSLLEDLIADLYSRLYEINLPHVMEQASEENKEKMKVDHLLMSMDGAADAPPAPGPGGTGPNPPTTISASGPTATASTETPTAISRGRTKGIARRDIQKRAEAIVNSKLTTRPPNTKPTTTTTTTTAAGTTTTEAEPPNGTAPAAPTATTAEAAEASTTKKNKAAVGEPGSVDDDSELSEIDDEKMSKLDSERERGRLFPNLKPPSPREPGSEMSVPDGDGEGDGDATAGEGEGENENEGDTMVEESFISAAPGDETELVDEEEGDEGDEEGGDVADGEVEGDGDAEDGEDEGEGDNEGEGETELLEKTEGGAEGEQSQVIGDEPEMMET